MLKRSSPIQGMTLMELVVVLAIFGILIAVTATISSLSGQLYRKSADTISDSIAAKLEEAKTDSITGKYGTSWGVKIATSSYVFFRGSYYNASDTNNVITSISSPYTLSSTVNSSTTAVVFSRMSGSPTATGTITVLDSNDSTLIQTITVGSLGDITVVK